MATEPPMTAIQDPSSLDSAIRQLLEQEADIQARLAALLPAKYGPNVSMELAMLRYKLRALQSYSQRHDIIDSTAPVLSEVEEARSLQYQCECIEAACLDRGIDIGCAEFIDELKLESSQSHDVPAGYSAWLERNLSGYDPVIRSWRMRESLAPNLRLLSSVKCWDDRCIHYIYGFYNVLDRDTHAHEHKYPTKRDSGLSLGNMSPASASFTGPHLLPMFGPISSSSTTGTPSIGLPRSRSGAYLPPLSVPAPQQKLRDPKDASQTSSFTSDTRSGRGSIDSEVDPLLPPLKRSRVGRPRLESIEELRLPREVGPCLRCKLSNAECDKGDPCSACTDLGRRGMEDDLFSPLGCHRAALAALSGILFPKILSPRQTQTPSTSPKVHRRRTVNEILEKSYQADTQLLATVRDHVDFGDGFWWGDDANGLGAPGRPSVHAITPSDWTRRPPPILVLLATSWNMKDVLCNFLSLLKTSGCLSQTRQFEQERYPVLYRAKMLLREVLFFDAQQSDSAIRSDLSQNSKHHMTAQDKDLDGRHAVLHESMFAFLQAFDEATARQDAIDCGGWASIFIALCIFSVVGAILSDVLALSPWGGGGGGQTSPPSLLLSSVHRVLVSALAWSSSLQIEAVMTELFEENEFFVSLFEAAIRRDTWAKRGVSSGIDFLSRIACGSFDGFIQPPRTMVASVNTPRNGSLTRRRNLVPCENAAAAAAAAVPVPGGTAIQECPPSAAPSVLSGWLPDAPLVDYSEGSYLRSSPERLIGPIQADAHPARRHTVAGGTPSSREAVQAAEGTVMSSLRLRASYQRPPLRRVFCAKCNEYPEGFRGEHELRRHTDAKHAALVRRWVCMEPQNYPVGSPRPIVPLSKCKACVTQKRYGAYYNAAAHLRRAHFHPNKAGKASGDSPPMSVLKDWMQEVQQSVDPNSIDNDSSSGGEEEDTKPLARFNGPLAQSSPAPTRMGTGPESATPMSCISMPMPMPLSLPMPMPMSVPMPMPVSVPMPVPLPTPPAPVPMPMTAASPAPTSTSLSTTAPVSSRVNIGPSGAQGATVMIIESASQVPGSRSRCPHPECGRVFKDMAAHMLTHQEERPEKCPIESCEYHVKGFARKYDKNRHALTHYKGTMICPFCPGAGTGFEKAFNRADVFKRHLTAVHNVEQTPPNGRKAVSSQNGGSTAVVTRSGSPAVPGLGQAARDTGAKCSICQANFGTAQEFYEHLDDCVLNVIVPVALKPQPQSGSQKDNMDIPMTAAETTGNSEQPQSEGIGGSD